jgi:hypothetical protein
MSIIDPYADLFPSWDYFYKRRFPVAVERDSARINGRTFAWDRLSVASCDLVTGRSANLGRPHA